MPGLVKIGMTTRDNTEERMKELYGTGVPVPFECKYACKVNISDCAKIEKALHSAFAPNRVNSNREFFVGATLAVAPLMAAVAPLTTAAVAQNDHSAVAVNRATARVAPTSGVGAIVGAYKSLVAIKCLEIYKLHDKYMGKLWQRNYWEHIIRNEKSYKRITNYIADNPANWKNDQFYSE
jgi:hypothetical protein